METSIKKWGTGVLVAPVLSLTILCAGGDVAFAESRTLLDKIFSSQKTKAPKAEQAGVAQPRLTQLEQAVRDLTVQVETLQFTVLQMQNRIDVLEGGNPSHVSLAEAKPVQEREPPQATLPPPQAASDSAPRVTQAQAAQIFGSVRFDGEGNLLHEGIPETDDPQELYKIGYQYILIGNYPAAEQVFRDFQARFPDDRQIADASFWLGEALYAQGQYREAAQVYIDVQRQHQDSLHGPENLLKLGLSMAQLQETEVACKTLAEVPKRYSEVEPAVLKRVHDEKNRLGCS